MADITKINLKGTLLTIKDQYAYHNGDLATVATSGSYNDLSNKPTIPAGVTVDQTITQNGTNPVQGGAIYSALQGKAEKTLVVNATAQFDSQTDEFIGYTLDKTSQQIIDAHNNGQQVVCLVDEDHIYSLCRVYDDGESKRFVAFQGVPNNSGFAGGISIEYYYDGNDIVEAYGRNLVPTSLKINNKPLSSDITLNASDVGALPASTTIPSKTSDLTNDSGFINKSMYYGTSTTAADTMPKVCTVETFPTYTNNGVTHAKEGTIIAVKFTNSDTNTTDAPELNVNGIGAKAIMYNNAIVTSTAKNTTIAGYAKQIAYYRYDPDLDEGNGAWEYLGKSVDSNSTYSNASLGQGYAMQSNSAAATAITASISSYSLSAGGFVTIKFTYDVPANATLNISSNGAKAIYNQGSPITAGVIKAGDTATFIYSTYYHLVSVDSWQENGKPLIANLIAHYDENDSLDYYTCNKTYAQLCEAIAAGRQVYLFEDEFYGIQLQFSRDGRLQGDTFLQFNSYITGLDGDTFEVDIYDDNSVDFQNWSYANSSDVVHKIYPISYSLLVTRKNASKLTSGAWYRITDYNCTTTQTDTQSAGHQFDILVQATSPNTLSEEARAIRHSGDTYFTNSNLEAWKIWYCLDNDTTRFTWADTTNGKGVIYHMIDEWNNDCPYDFKNIQFKRKLSDGVLDTTNGDDTFVYTFNLWRVNTSNIEDASIIGNTLENEEGHITGVYGNKINPVSEYNVYSEQTSFEVTQYLLNDNVFLNSDDEDGFFYGCYTNILGYDCFSNTFGNGCGSNTFGNYVGNNTFGNYVGNNTFGNNAYNNTFGNYFQFNSFGNGCGSNTFGNDCGNNTFGNYVSNNTFGNNCGDNTFGNDCWNNTFGNYVGNNTFGNNAYNNTFGNGCGSNTFGNNCYFNTFSKPYTQHVIVENGNRRITLTSTQTPTSSNPLRNITIAQGVNNTDTTKTISHNTLNDTFRTTYTTDINGNIYAIAPAKYDEWDNKQSALVSGTNIKTINNQSLLGSGNLTANDIGAATVSDVNTAISNLVDSAPTTLNTLNELATALGNDPNFATTITNKIAALQVHVGSVAGKLYRNNVAGSGNFTVTGNSGCIPNLTAGTFLVSIYAKSTTQSYTFRFNFGSVTYDLSTTNGEISDVRQITIPSNGTFSGLVLNGSVASGTILYVVMYNYLTPISTVGPAAVTNRYADLDGTPTIPTVNNGTLTIQRNGTTLGTFTANLSSNTTANINVPILTSVTVSGTGAVTQALDSNKFYKFGSLTSLILTLNAASEGLAIYGGKFTAGTNDMPINLPSGIMVPDDAVSIESGKTYEFNILDGICIIVDVTAS